ncbi:MAG: glycosyltransferase [Chloroflexota bacterium]
MATIILDLDFETLPEAIENLNGYEYALVLVRLGQKPVGQVRVPIVNNRIDGNDLHTYITDELGWPFLEKWLQNYLIPHTDVAKIDLPKVTVAICTRNRTEDLARCLEALLQLPDEGQEVLVIDNNPSTDATEELLRQYDQIRYIRDDRPGLNNARNRALYEAKHEIVAFLDDDTVPDVNWLRTLSSNYDDPFVMCVTGLVMPFELETEAQEWFEHFISFTRGFRRKVFERAFHRSFGAGRCGVGANMSVRRSVLEVIGPFDPALDAGTPTYSGGDNEMFLRILSSGYRIVYDPAALIWHRHRSTWAELCHQMYGYGVGNCATWTRKLLIDRDFSVLRNARKTVQRRLAELCYALLRRPDHLPLDLIVAMLLGYVKGPWAYFVSRRQNLKYQFNYDSRSTNS